ncbi:MAG: M13 family metallopeptidase [Minisyncoccia bacterium]
MKKRGWGFEVRDMDAAVRPQDDFYHYASGAWLKKNPVPKNESRWGSFMILRLDTDRKIHAIVEEVSKKRQLPKGSSEQLIRDFYHSGMDMKRRNALHISPLQEIRKDIASAQNTDDIELLIAKLHRIGVGVFFNAGVDQDSKKSTRYALHLHQDGLGLPDRDYYLKDDTESTRVRRAYHTHVEGLFRLLGRKDALSARDAVLRIETLLARHSMTKEDRRDADKTYHKMTVTALTAHAPGFDWKRYFKKSGVGTPSSLIVMQPYFFARLRSILRSTPLEELKTYLVFHLVNDYASCLSLRFVKHQFAFYGKVLSGAKEMKPLWRRTLGAVNGALGEVLGKLYVARHFSASAKRKMDQLVDDLFEAYEARLKGLDWMSPHTKRKALRKLAAMNRKIGYPRRWKSYAGLTIDAQDFAGNVMRASEFHHKKDLAKLTKPIDRDEWFMYPQTVNAYFAPNLNDIVFPAAILQPPFFNEDADDALNYGAIGSVIGHEITHGFDDQGSKYDHEGNLKAWWTPADRKRFEKKAAIVCAQYDRYKVADGVKVNGKLTLGENIADLGGLSIAYDAYERRLRKTGKHAVGGFTPEQRFFLGFTLFDRENATPEFQKMQVLTDPHSPGIFRINGPASNMESFYAAYGVEKGDKLYRDKRNRTTVW